MVVSMDLLTFSFVRTSTSVKWTISMRRLEQPRGEINHWNYQFMFLFLVLFSTKNLHRPSDASPTEGETVHVDNIPEETDETLVHVERVRLGKGDTVADRKINWSDFEVGWSFAAFLVHIAIARISGVYYERWNIDATWNLSQILNAQVLRKVHEAFYSHYDDTGKIRDLKVILWIGILIESAVV